MYNTHEINIYSPCRCSSCAGRGFLTLFMEKLLRLIPGLTGEINAELFELLLIDV